VSATTAAPMVAPVRRTRRRSALGSVGVVGWICLAVIVFAAVIAVIGPYIAPFDPTASDLSLSYVGPDGAHVLGYDAQGRDVLSRLLVGARSSMVGPLAVVLLSMFAGVVLAVTAAWRRGLTDAGISAGLDIAFAFPGILLAILAAAVFGASLLAATLAIAIAYTPYVARILRGAALKERSLLYVSALEVQGTSALAICGRHLVPNLLPLIVAQATIMFGWAMVDLAAVSYLGLGVQPPDPDWGVMIAENQAGIMQGYPLPALSAGICIVVVVVAFNVLGERLYEAAQHR
jgi:peptide/nickel transport system permease protein